MNIFVQEPFHQISPAISPLGIYPREIKTHVLPYVGSCREEWEVTADGHEIPFEVMEMF